jgi:hypothetical protein
MVKAVLPVLFKVKVCDELVMSIGTFPKAKLAGDRLTAGAVLAPVPESVTVCGLPLALSLIWNEAVAEPAAAGVKTTLKAQLVPAATDVPQLLVCVKSPGLVPVNAALVMLNAALPVLLKVTVWGELAVLVAMLPKARLAGARLTVVPVLTPVPERLTTLWVLPKTLSTRIREALKVPAVAGVKLTLIVQEVATLDPQLLDWLKSPGFAPASAMLEILKFSFPPFVRVMVWGALAVPAAWLENVRLLVDRLAVGPSPVP